MKTPPLIPRELFFGPSKKWSVEISPDGKFLSWLAVDEKGVSQVWIKSLQGRQAARVLTADKKRGIHWYRWAWDGRHLLYQQDQEGDENFHVHSVDMVTGLVRDLTPFQGRKASLIEVSQEHPGTILVGINLRDPGKLLFDVYRVDLESGALEFVAENPGTVLHWLADACLEVRAALAQRKDGGAEIWVRPGQGKRWKTLRGWGPEELGELCFFSKDGRTLFFKSTLGANALRLVSVNLDSGVEKVWAEDEQYDVGAVVFHPVTRKLQAVAIERDKTEWQVLDPAVKKDFEALARARRGNISLSSRDLADRQWLVCYDSDDAPRFFHLYDRKTRKSRCLFSNRPELESVPFATMRPISYTSRDGLTIHGYLTLPSGSAGKDLPLILEVHGGPYERFKWGFSTFAQWLANRGYAVLQVNFRGSSGYGKRFFTAGNREWGAKMHDDLIDGVEWAVGQGIADRKKVAIWGMSYGGYATLVGLTATPEVFACGIDLVGPSNLLSLMTNPARHWKLVMELKKKIVGDPIKDRDDLIARSPFYHAHKIKRPLLIGQGANDPRATLAESDKFVAVARKAGVPVEYVVYPDEGHGFSRPQNGLHFSALMEGFFAKHLGGRCEPMGDLKGFSAKINP